MKYDWGKRSFCNRILEMEACIFGNRLAIEMDYGDSRNQCQRITDNLIDNSNSSTM